MNAALRAELLAMIREDGRVRGEISADGSLFEGYHPRMEAVHAKNARRLEVILAEHGWPVKSLVGQDGAEAAWRIAQHAIGLPDFQRRCLALLEDAASRGDIPRWQPAYMLDRIRMFEGKPQVYGTQFELDSKGEMSPYAIEDPEGANSRRAAVGLDSIEERTKRMRAEAAAESKKAPADRAEYRKRYEEWLTRVGWRK